MRFFFPHFEDEIDWSKRFEFLDTELPKIIRGLRKGKRTADRLIKVYMKNGESKYFLIHVEVQSQEDKTLSERMFKMFYRIHDKYDVNVSALAILAYKGSKEKGLFSQSFLGSKVEFTYNIYELFNEVENGKIDDSNIFSLIVRSVYLDLKYGENETVKYKWKYKLVENFLKRKPTPEEYQVLLNFIVMFVHLNSDLDQKVEKLYS